MLSANEFVLKVSGVSKRFERKQVLAGIDICLSAQDVFGYLGPNGAGKTTTISIILGLLRADEGSVAMNAERLGFVLEKPGLYEELSLIDNLAFFGELVGSKDKERMKFWVQKVRLQNELNTQVKKFSLGMKKRAEIARALLNDPSLLILDEPTSGLDPIGQIEVRNLIQEMAKDRMCTILITSHNLHEVEQICNKVAILNEGKISYSSTMEAIKQTGNSLESIYSVVVGSRE